MTNQIQFSTFNFHSNAVRVIVDPNQEFWFCGTDVCNVLGYCNAVDALVKHCKPKGIAKRYTPTNGGNQELTFINEPNLYRLIIKSRKPEAEPFEAWVFEEVLPQIRKTGQYSQKSTEIAPLTITPEQQQQIQNAVQATHHRTGLSYAEIYQRLKAKFHVAKYDQLRQDQHREAMIFIAGMSAIVAKTESGNVLKLSLIDVMSLLVYLKKVNRQFAQVLGLVRHIRNHYDIHDLDTLLEDFRDRLLDEDYRHFLKLINDYAKECDPYHKTLLKSTLTIN